MAEVLEMPRRQLMDEGTIRAFGFLIGTRAEFEAGNRPAGLKERAAEYPGAFVVWDDLNDVDGLLIIGDDRAEIAREAAEFLRGAA